jgi:hypothetical protein
LEEACQQLQNHTRDETHNLPLQIACHIIKQDLGPPGGSSFSFRDEPKVNEEEQVTPQLKIFLQCNSHQNL